MIEKNKQKKTHFDLVLFLSCFSLPSSFIDDIKDDSIQTTTDTSSTTSFTLGEKKIDRCF